MIDGIAREGLAACGGSSELGKALMAGLLPSRPALGDESWAAEARAALGELEPLWAAAVAAAAEGASAAATAARLVQLAAYARMGIAYAESRGEVRAPEGELVSPYDRRALEGGELEASLAPLLGPAGRERRRAVFRRYAAALVGSKGVPFAAAALAVEARAFEPEELWFADLFRSLALFLAERRGVDIAFAAAIIRDANPRNGFSHREAALAVSDFLVDDRYSARAIERLLSFIRSCALLLHPDRTAAFAKVLRLAKDFVRLSRSTDERYVGIILKTFLEHPYLELGEWVGEGARLVFVAGAGSAEARAFFDRSSEASLKVWEAIDVGIPFEKAAPRLRPFVAALAERSVALAKSPAGRGHLFMTDGETIYVPAYAMYVKDRESNYLMLRHGAAHECAHIEFGSFSRDEARYRSAAAHLARLFPGAWGRNVAVAKSYRARVAKALLELGYRVKTARFASPDDLPPMSRLYFMTDFPLLYRDLVNIVEDRRVDARLYAKYPGYAAEKARVDEMDFGDLPGLDEFPEAARFIQAFLELVLLGRVKGELAGPDAAAAAELARMTERDDPFAADAFDSAATAADALRFIVGFLGARYPKALAKMRAAANRLDVSLAFLGARACERNGLLEFELEDIRSDPEVGGESAAIAEERNAAFGEALRDYGQVELPEPLAGRRLFVYPEWVDWKLAYDREACLLAEFPPEFIDAAFPEATPRRALSPSGSPATGGSGGLRARESQAAEAVRRAFASIKENLEVLERGAEDGEDIDFDRAVDCFTDFASGGRVDMDFYLRRSRKARDLLCALVLDLSPSTSLAVEGRAIYEHELSAAYLMAEAMAAVGDDFGIFSYYDFGARATIFHLIKEFDAPYDEAVVDALASLRCAERGFSRIAPGLRHILAKMEEREARAKIVFLVTDGQPVYLDAIRDEGKSSTTYYVDGREVQCEYPVRVRSMTTASESYAYADLAKVAEEARLGGVRLFCVTLDERSVQPLSRVFGDSLIYLDRVSSLPSHLVEIFRKMTR